MAWSAILSAGTAMKWLGEVETGTGPVLEELPNFCGDRFSIAGSRDATCADSWPATL